MSRATALTPLLIAMRARHVRAAVGCDVRLTNAVVIGEVDRAFGFDCARGEREPCEEFP